MRFSTIWFHLQYPTDILLPLPCSTLLRCCFSWVTNRVARTTTSRGTVVPVPAALCLLLRDVSRTNTSTFRAAAAPALFSLQTTTNNKLQQQTPSRQQDRVLVVFPTPSHVQHAFRDSCATYHALLVTAALPPPLRS
jgi:hypothetical protein